MNNKGEQLSLGLEGVENPAPPFVDPNDESKLPHQHNPRHNKSRRSGSQRPGGPTRRDTIVRGHDKIEDAGKMVGSGKNQF